MRWATAALVFCTLLLGACNDEGDPQQEALNENRAKWNDAGVSSYVFQLARSCFCLVEEPIVVTVTNGVVTSAFFTPSGVMLAQDRMASLRTVDGFFGFVQEAIDRDVDELVVSYDATYGFPDDIFVNEGFELADDEISYNITNFQ